MPDEQLLTYCIDSSALIDLDKNYPADHFPGVWQNLGILVESERLITVDLVREECKDDALVEWFGVYPRVVVGHSEELENCVRRVMADVVSSGKELVDFQNAKSDADPFVIACAMAFNLRENGSFSSGPCVVVQHEKSAQPSLKRVRMPDVCEWYSISYMNLVDVIRLENWIFR